MSQIGKASCRGGETIENVQICPVGDFPNGGGDLEPPLVPGVGAYERSMIGDDFLNQPHGAIHLI